MVSMPSSSSTSASEKFTGRRYIRRCHGPSTAHSPPPFCIYRSEGPLPSRGRRQRNRRRARIESRGERPDVGLRRVVTLRRRDLRRDGMLRSRRSLRTRRADAPERACRRRARGLWSIILTVPLVSTIIFSSLMSRLAMPFAEGSSGREHLHANSRDMGSGTEPPCVASWSNRPGSRTDGRQRRPSGGAR